MSWQLSAINQQRWHRFVANRRAWWSLWLFLVVFVVALFSEFVANNKPLLIRYDGQLYTPIFNVYTELEFGGDFEAEADYRDPYIADLINEKGWMIWPPIRYSYNTINYDLPSPAPSPPTSENLLGTDDRGRDVVARILYGFRLSVLFGFSVTVLSAVIGSVFSTLYGDLEQPAIVIYFDHSGQCCCAKRLVAAWLYIVVQLDGICRCSAS
jgi:microcin C transport system permease protein